MSIENIIDYVIKTPKNTNPNVIRSLVKSEVDENTLQKAKEYTDSQRLGYIEPAKALHYIIDIDNLKAEDLFLGTFAKISDDPLDLTKVSKISVNFPDTTDEVIEFTNFKVGPMVDVNPDPDRPMIEHTCLFVIEEGEQFPFVLSFTEDRADYPKSLIGTWLFFGATDTTIEFSEVVHPIDPKYLPCQKINLYDYGIDLYSILMEMLTAGKTCVAKTVNVGYQFWEALGAAGDNFVFVQGGDYDYIAYTPSVYSAGSDMKILVGFNVSMVVDNNAFIKGSVFLKYNDANTSLLIMEATMITPE